MKLNLVECLASVHGREKRLVNLLCFKAIAKVLEADKEMHKLQKSIATGIQASAQEIQAYVRAWDE